MAQIIINNLDDSTLKTLTDMAQKHNRSLEDEVQDILTTAINITPLGSRISKRFTKEGLRDGENITEWRGNKIEPPDLHQ